MNLAFGSLSAFDDGLGTLAEVGGVLAVDLAIGGFPALGDLLATLLSGREVELTDGLKARMSVLSH